MCAFNTFGATMDRTKIATCYRKIIESPAWSSQPAPTLSHGLELINSQQLLHISFLTWSCVLSAISATKHGHEEARACKIQHQSSDRKMNDELCSSQFAQYTQCWVLIIVFFAIIGKQ